MDQTLAVDLRQITKQFGTVLANDRGEIHALLAYPGLVCP